MVKVYRDRLEGGYDVVENGKLTHCDNKEELELFKERNKHDESESKN